MDGEESRRLESRFCRTLEQARRLMAYWQTEYDVTTDDVHDNSEVDLDHIFAWMNVDLDCDAEEVR